MNLKPVLHERPEPNDRVGIFPVHFPMRDDVGGLADQRQSFVGMRRQFEEQQRQALRGPRADGDIGTAHRDTLGVGYGARLEQPFQFHALPLAFA